MVSGAENIGGRVVGIVGEKELVPGERFVTYDGIAFTGILRRRRRIPISYEETFVNDRCHSHRRY